MAREHLPLLRYTSNLLKTNNTRVAHTPYASLPSACICSRVFPFEKRSDGGSWYKHNSPQQQRFALHAGDSGDYPSRAKSHLEARREGRLCVEMARWCIQTDPFGGSYAVQDARIGAQAVLVWRNSTRTPMLLMCLLHVPMMRSITNKKRFIYKRCFENGPRSRIPIRNSLSRQRLFECSTSCNVYVFRYCCSAKPSLFMVA